MCENYFSCSLPTIKIECILALSSWNMAMMRFLYGCSRNEKLHTLSIRFRRTVAKHI